MIKGFWQKIGFWPAGIVKAWKSKTNWIWFHAVSVGELNAVWPLILEVNKQKPFYPVMISCTTEAGYSLAKKLTSTKDFLVLYFPFDIPQVIQSLLNHAKIKLLIIVETEIWPNVLSECYRRSIPTILVNARLSDKSFKNYLFLKFYFKPVVNLFTKVLAQSENDLNKFKKIGLEENKIKITGNIKFPREEIINYSLNGSKPETKGNNIKIIFASTHRGEDEIALEILKNLKTDFQNIRLTIAPRHINRTKEIAELIKKNNFKPILKTDNIEPASVSEILVLNTIGELVNYYKTSDITILGGTFAKIGGHNILEPIMASSYTIIGPNDFKISELTNLFKSKNAIVQVNDTSELIIKIKEALLNKNIRENVIRNGIKIIKENANILRETTNEIIAYL